MEGYRTLVERFGAGRVADALLAKWLADPDADTKWERLQAKVGLYEYIPRPSKKALPRWHVVLWHYSNGHEVKEVAELMGISPHTVTRTVKYARQALGIRGPIALLVATAIRRGIIP